MVDDKRRILADTLRAQAAAMTELARVLEAQEPPGRAEEPFADRRPGVERDGRPRDGGGYRRLLALECSTCGGWFLGGPSAAMLKQCDKCKAEKPPAQFSKCARYADGLQRTCKACFSAYNRARYEAKGEEIRAKVAAYREANPDKVLAAKRSWKRTPKGRAADRRYARRFRARHPEKRIAREMVGHAIEKGRLRPGPCEVCGSPKAEAHHHDYFKPLDVHWLCRPCHAAEHRKAG